MTTYLLTIKYSVASFLSQMVVPPRSSFHRTDGEKSLLSWRCCARKRDNDQSLFCLSLAHGSCNKYLHSKKCRELYKIFARMINVGVLCDICFVWQGMLSSDQKRGSAVLPLLPDSCMNEEAKGKNISASRNWLLHNKSRLKDFLLQRVDCLVKICKEFICLFWDQYSNDGLSRRGQHLTNIFEVSLNPHFRANFSVSRLT